MLNAKYISDVADPIITCPNSTSYSNEPGKNYTFINVPTATAFDIVAIVSLTSNYNSPLKLTVGTPVKVTYTAKDAAGNSATCTALLEAKGKTLSFIVPSFSKDYNHIQKSKTFNHPGLIISYYKVCYVILNLNEKIKHSHVLVGKAMDWLVWRDDFENISDTFTF